MNKRWPNKYIIGLTGNIATGKSVVLEMAADQGALAIDADKIVHRLLNSDAGVQKTVESAFGSIIRNPDGSINRGRLGAIVFENEEKLAILERIVHPAVRRALQAMVDESEERIVFIEAIKLLESGLVQECDQVWVTRCPREVQIERLIAFRNMDEESAALRVSAQPHQDEKISAADVVIDTAGSIEDTAGFFNMAWQRLLRNVPGPIAVWQSKQLSSVAKNKNVSILSQKPQNPSEESGINTLVQANADQGTQSRRSMELEDNPFVAAAGPPNVVFQTEGVTIHRATPSDVPDILWLIRRTAGSAVRTKRRELLMSLGERGYLIGRRDGQISALAGWSSENLVATVDLIIITPPEDAFHTGAALMREIENTANSLVCEVILAFPPTNPPEQMQILFDKLGYTEVQAETLPNAWQISVQENRPHDTLVLMKILRDTRPVGLV